MNNRVRRFQSLSEASRECLKKQLQSIAIHLLIEHREGIYFLTSKYEAIQVLDLQEEARELDAQCKARAVAFGQHSCGKQQSKLQCCSMLQSCLKLSITSN